MAARFRAAGLVVQRDSFRVPGKGTSRNVVGILDTPASCLRVVMAHVDTVPPSPGADDNASGVGALVALGDALPASAPSCDVWLVATGAEERIYTERPDHLGALAVVGRIRRTGRSRDVRWALSIDEVGSSRRFAIRSRARRSQLEGALLTAARSGGVRANWLADGPGGGQSDHRELAMAGYVSAKFGVTTNPRRHTAADRVGLLRRSAFADALNVLWPVVSG